MRRRVEHRRLVHRIALHVAFVRTVAATDHVEPAVRADDLRVAVAERRLVVGRRRRRGDLTARRVPRQADDCLRSRIRRRGVRKRRPRVRGRCVHLGGCLRRVDAVDAAARADGVVFERDVRRVRNRAERLPAVGRRRVAIRVKHTVGAGCSQGIDLPAGSEQHGDHRQRQRRLGRVRIGCRRVGPERGDVRAILVDASAEIDRLSDRDDAEAVTRRRKRPDRLPRVDRRGGRDGRVVSEH